jgi:hypothetical protein
MKLADERAFVLSLASALVVGAIGCGPNDDTAFESGELRGSIGVLQVERSSSLEGGRSVVRAAFARYQGIDRTAVLQLLGASPAAGAERCALVGAGEDLWDEDANVELVEAGTLEVSLAASATRLSPRTFPDLASVVEGVFYAGDAPLTSPTSEADEYRFMSDGSLEVGPFDALVPAPAELTGLRVSGAGGFSAGLGSSPVEVSRTRALTLEWEAIDPHDELEVELTSGAQSVVCSARDEGSLRIPTEVLAELEPHAAGRLTVRRVRVARFDAAGLEETFARVAVAHTFDLLIR